jgi:hypothetical protein
VALECRAIEVYQPRGVWLLPDSRDLAREGRVIRIEPESTLKTEPHAKFDLVSGLATVVATSSIGNPATTSH